MTDRVDHDEAKALKTARAVLVCYGWGDEDAVNMAACLLAQHAEIEALRHELSLARERLGPDGVKMLAELGALRDEVVNLGDVAKEQHAELEALRRVREAAKTLLGALPGTTDKDELLWRRALQRALTATRTGGGDG